MDYLISSHPGSTMRDAVALAVYLKENRIRFVTEAAEVSLVRLDQLAGAVADQVLPPRPDQRLDAEAAVLRLVVLQWRTSPPIFWTSWCATTSAAS